jgi:co-chaperonin GroES (HSP10)
MKTGVEWGTITALGPDVQGPYKVGDKIFVKAWSVDTILYNNVEYVFTSESRKGICAIVK